MRAPFVSLLVVAGLAGCATSVPTRYVVERDIDDFGYRRYQHVLDVEFQVAENPAEGHTATYFRRGDRVVLATAFVSVYEKARGLAEEIRERVEDLATYDAAMQKLEGEWVWVLEGDAPWVLWVSANRVIKLGGPAGGAVPEAVLEALSGLERDYRERGVELVEVAGGYRIQVRREVAPWVARLWEERPARYSRALLETLALIAYRQPITRGEIEEIRGVVVSTHIVRTLVEREWVRVVGHRDVPGRPALYATTRGFLDYFGLRSLDELPPLAEIRSLESAGEVLAELSAAPGG